MSLFDIKIKLAPADAATSMNLVCGLVSMLEAAQGRFEQAVWLIAGAMIFDSVDGNLAKMFNTTSDFGRELDSLSDMVSFGAAPAFLFAHYLAGPDLAVPMMLAPLAYAVSAAVRLARFNIRPPVRGYFRGLPSPAAALSAGIFMLVALHSDWVAMAIFPGIAMAGMGLLAFLMVSPVLYPKPFGPDYKRWRPFFAATVFSGMVSWFFFDIETGFLTGILAYVLAAPFYGLTLKNKIASALN